MLYFLAVLEIEPGTVVEEDNFSGTNNDTIKSKVTSI